VHRAPWGTGQPPLCRAFWTFVTCPVSVFLPLSHLPGVIHPSAAQPCSETPRCFTSQYCIYHRPSIARSPLACAKRMPNDRLWTMLASLRVSCKTIVCDFLLTVHPRGSRLVSPLTRYGRSCTLWCGAYCVLLAVACDLRPPCGMVWCGVVWSRGYGTGVLYGAAEGSGRTGRDKWRSSRAMMVFCGAERSTSIWGWTAVLQRVSAAPEISSDGMGLGQLMSWVRIVKRLRRSELKIA